MRNTSRGMTRGPRCLDDGRDNVVMTRTFSKLYGLGGLRVGWGYGPQQGDHGRAEPCARAVQREPSGAGARPNAAVRDTAYLSRTAVAKTRGGATWMADGLWPKSACRRMPVKRQLCVWRGWPSASQKRRDCDAYLCQARGCWCVRVGGYKLPAACLRITVGDESAAAAKSWYMRSDSLQGQVAA